MQSRSTTCGWYEEKKKNGDKNRVDDMAKRYEKYGHAVTLADRPQFNWMT